MTASVACIICKHRGTEQAVALGEFCLCEACQRRLARWVGDSAATERQRVWQLRKPEAQPMERLSQLPDVTLQLSELSEFGEPGEAPEIVVGLPPTETMRMVEVWLKLGWVDEALTSAARVTLQKETDEKTRSRAFGLLFDSRYLVEDGVEVLRRALYPA